MSKRSQWRSLRLRLQALEQSVAEEIKSYPPPIPACDAQFNHLLELRRILPRELARLESAARGDSITIDGFIRSSPCKAELSKLVPGS